MNSCIFEEITFLKFYAVVSISHKILWNWKFIKTVIFSLGSFERQFDDEFNDLTENDTINEESGGGGNEESRTSSPLFGNINIGTTFSISDGQALEDLAAEDLIPSSPDEMPLEGLSISQEVFDLGFLDPFNQGTEDQPF